MVPFGTKDQWTGNS